MRGTVPVGSWPNIAAFAVALRGRTNDRAGSIIGGKRGPHGSFVAAAIKHDISALQILGRTE